jgi:choline dehydrogenase-like flavoprotein
MFGYNLLPESQGSVHAISADPRAPPEIVHNYLTHPKDQAVSIAMFRFMRALYEQPAVKPFITEEMLPGSLVQSDADILQAFNRLGGTGYHATGTCSMGNEPLGVVDARLQVRGVGGLRVCDLSVFPTNIAGNTQGPAMAAGWRGAELILEDHR